MAYKTPRIKDLSYVDTIITVVWTNQHLNHVKCDTTVRYESLNSTRPVGGCVR